MNLIVNPRHMQQKGLKVPESLRDPRGSRPGRLASSTEASRDKTSCRRHTQCIALLRTSKLSNT